MGYNRQWYVANRESVLAKARAYAATHKEKRTRTTALGINGLKITKGVEGTYGNLCSGTQKTGGTKRIWSAR